MIYIVIPVVLLYYYFFLFYYRKLFPMQKKRPIQVMLILAIIASSYIYLTPLGKRLLLPRHTGSDQCDYFRRPRSF